MLDPLLCLRPCLVQRKKTSLATTLDELVRLCNELRREDPAGELGVGRDGTGGRVPGNLCDLGRRVDELGRNLRGGVNGRCALEPVREDELRVVFTDG